MSDPSNNSKVAGSPETIDMQELEKGGFSNIEKVIEAPDNNIESPESDQESIREVQENISEGQAGKEKANAQIGGIVAATNEEEERKIRYKQIEDVLSQDLEDYYLSMDGPTQFKFKTAGEEASRNINDLLDKGKATAKKLVEIIRRWLIMIPGVNKFFIEQEAKIKADKLLNIQNKHG